jgi:tRNA pseudouridine55 synthase
MPVRLGETTAPPDGLLLIDKTAGITSHDVIAIARRRLGMTRIGHAGTLDPAATGLLLLLLGRATRLLPYLDAEPKVYEAIITFGRETDTDDASGVVTREAPLPDESAVHRAVAALTGEIEQVPPAVSAKQRSGTRAYRAARRGRPMDLAPQPVRVFSWDAVEFSGDTLSASIVCAGGTYVRALARDLGRRCGSAAHLSSLRRTRAGPFFVEDAVPVQELSDDVGHVLPPLAALPTTLQRVTLAADLERMVRHGRSVPALMPDQRVAIVGAAGELLAVAELSDGDWRPRVVLTDD